MSASEAENEARDVDLATWHNSGCLLSKDQACFLGLLSPGVTPGAKHTNWSHCFMSASFLGDKEVSQVHRNQMECPSHAVLCLCVASMGLGFEGLCKMRCGLNSSKGHRVLIQRGRLF